MVASRNRIILKWLLGLAMITGIVLWPRHALAVPCSQALVFTTGEVLTATVLNTNPANEVACINNIDNTNIGANGIYASQIVPTTAGQATFGGTLGYTFSPGNVNAIPLTITNAASPTVDYLDVTNNASTKLLYIDKNGVIHAGSQYFTADPAYGATSCPAQVYQWNGSAGASEMGASSAIVAAGVTGQTLGLCSTTSSVLAVDNQGQLGVVSNGSFGGNLQAAVGGSTRSFVPPVYTSAGAAVANTLHAVFGSFSLTLSCTNVFTGISGATVQMDICNSGNVTLSGAAAFASSTSYACTITTTAVIYGAVVQPTSGTVFSVNVWQSGNATPLAGQYVCIGT